MKVIIAKNLFIILISINSILSYELRNNNQGILEIKQQNTWKNVCHKGFGQQDANAACKSLNSNFNQKATYKFGQSCENTQAWQLTGYDKNQDYVNYTSIYALNFEGTQCLEGDNLESCDITILDNHDCDNLYQCIYLDCENEPISTFEEQEIQHIVTGQMQGGIYQLCYNENMNKSTIYSDVICNNIYTNQSNGNFSGTIEAEYCQYGDMFLDFFCSSPDMCEQQPNPACDKCFNIRCQQFIEPNENNNSSEMDYDDSETTSYYKEEEYYTISYERNVKKDQKKSSSLNLIFIILGVCIFVSIIVVIIILRQRKQNKKQKQALQTNAQQEIEQQNGQYQNKIDIQQNQNQNPQTFVQQQGYPQFDNQQQISPVQPYFFQNQNQDTPIIQQQYQHINNKQVQIYPLPINNQNLNYNYPTCSQIDNNQNNQQNIVKGQNIQIQEIQIFEEKGDKQINNKINIKSQ